MRSRASRSTRGRSSSSLGLRGLRDHLDRAEEVRAQRDKAVPLRGKMGSGWDIGYASLFLHSDEARFITGIVLPVDGGQGAKVG